MRRQPITLSSREQATLVRLLSRLQSLTETGIECHVVGGKMDGVPGEGFAGIVARLRRLWRETEDMLMRFGPRRF